MTVEERDFGFDPAEEEYERCLADVAPVSDVWERVDRAVEAANRRLVDDLVRALLLQDVEKLDRLDVWDSFYAFTLISRLDGPAKIDARDRVVEIVTGSRVA